MHTEFKPDARKNRTRAALSELNERIMSAAAKKGRLVVGAEGERARICAECGGALEFEKDSEAMVCAACKRITDPLVNAARYIAQRAAESREAISDVHAKAMATQGEKLKRRAVLKQMRIAKRKEKAAAERGSKDVDANASAAGKG